MAFLLGFTTEAYNQGKSILIEDDSAYWNDQVNTITQVVFTITSLYSDAELTTDPVVVTFDTSEDGNEFEVGFQYEITAQDLFGDSYVGTVKDSIYHIEMALYISGPTELTDDGYSYESDEVFYYNLMGFRDTYVATNLSYKDNIYERKIHHTNWLDFLVTTVESNTTYGNTSAIYYIFDVEERLSS
jgi:hypothetical protein